MLNKAVIDLKVIRENAKNVKAGLKDGALFNAVVKADAYGHGDAMCANAVYDVADMFSVALAEEGVRLRRAGIDKKILVLTEPFIEDARLFARYGLTASVSRIGTLAFLDAAARREGAKIGAHIKVNTGMNRLGCGLSETEALADSFDRYKNVKLEGIYSHFYAPEEKRALSAQLDEFLLAYKLINGYNRDILAHISASGGYLAGVHLDMCRVGLLLYGYKPFESDAVEVAPAMKVFAPTVEVRRLKRGQHLLYGAAPLEKDCTASIYRYGYADGLFRQKSGDLLNNRCMDLSAEEGERGERNVLENLERTARENGTIPYEILCSAARRCEKVYLR